MNTELETNLPEPRPFNCRPQIWWMGFLPYTDFPVAAAIFERKHGHPPREELRTDGALLVGPIDADLR